MQAGILDQSDDGNGEVIDLPFDPVQATHHRIDFIARDSTMRPSSARMRTRSSCGHDQTPAMLKVDDDTSSRVRRDTEMTFAME